MPVRSHWNTDITSPIHRWYAGSAPSPDTGIEEAIAGTLITADNGFLWVIPQNHSHGVGSTIIPFGLSASWLTNPTLSSPKKILPKVPTRHLALRGIPPPCGVQPACKFLDSACQGPLKVIAPRSAMTSVEGRTTRNQFIAGRTSPGSCFPLF